jgi:AcrR family transcriptional regulator
VTDSNEQLNPQAERILLAAAGLLRSGGIDAVSTRAVSAAAGVQPPTIYRQFGDKSGLLNAVSGFVLREYVKKKRMLVGSTEDPVDELRQLWELHVQFGMDEPDCYVLCYGQARPGQLASAASETVDLLRQVIERLGDQGRLRMSVDRATTYWRSAGTGFILTQIGSPPAERDPDLAGIIFDNTVAAITTDREREPQPASDLPGRAVALRQALQGKENLPLSDAEQTLLSEWLNRLADDTKRDKPRGGEYRKTTKRLHQRNPLAERNAR